MHKICFICFGDLLHRHSHNQTQTSQRWSIHWFARAFLGYVYNSYLLSKVLINKKKRKLEFFSTMTSSQCAHAIYTNVHLANYINKKSFPSGCVLNTGSRTSNSAPHARPPGIHRMFRIHAHGPLSSHRTMQRIVHPLRGDDLIGRCPPFDPLHQREQDVVTGVGEPRNAVDDGAQHGLLVHAGEVPGHGGVLAQCLLLWVS